MQGYNVGQNLETCPLWLQQKHTGGSWRVKGGGMLGAAVATVFSMDSCFLFPGVNTAGFFWCTSL